MNLLTVSPLYDSKGKLRYFIGAQVDVSGLCKDATNLESLRQMLKHRKTSSQASQMNGSTLNDHPDVVIGKEFQETVKYHDDEESGSAIDKAFQELSEMLTETELDIARYHGGRAHDPQSESNGAAPSLVNSRPRIHLRESSDGEQKKNPDMPTPLIRRNPYFGLFQNVSSRRCLNAFKSFPNSVKSVFACSALSILADSLCF
jgi:hypothetical protein